MSTRARNLLILVAIAAAALLGAVLVGQPRARRGVLDATPSSSFLVATLDAEALRASPLADLARRGAGAGIPGVSKLSEACGWDVLARVTELAVAVPEEGNTGEFGLAARGDVTRSELSACADKVMAARGGKAKLTPRGSFVVLEEDDAAATGSGGPAPKIAYGEGGPLLVARGAWLNEMMDAAEGKRPSARASTEHASLREAVTAGHKKPTLVATALLPKPLRDRLRREMGVEASDPKAAGGDDAAMAGVLAVSAVGLSVAVGKGEQPTELLAELRCETEAACAGVKALIERMRLGWSQDFRLRLVGLGPLIDALTATAHGASVTVSTRIPSDDLARVVDRLLELRGSTLSAGRRPSQSPTEPAPSPPRQPQIPDETIRAPGRAPGHATPHPDPHEPGADGGRSGAPRKAP